MRSPARVLHVLKHFRPTYTGEGIFTERLTPVMDVLAPDIEHEMLATETPLPAAVIPESSTLRRIIYLTGRPMAAWRREILLLWWLARNLHRYRVVHFHTHVDRHFLAYLLVKLGFRRMLLSATLTDSVPGLIRTYTPRYRGLFPHFFRLFDAFIALSPKLHAENGSIMPSARTHLVPIGIVIPEPAPRQQTARAAYGIAGDDLVLIFVGGICARKDPLFLVEQLPELLRSFPRLKLLIVGPVLEPEYHADILRTIAAQSLQSQIIFTGEVRDPYPLFAIADIVVFASHQEGFGAAVIEGMAHGLPVVVQLLPDINDGFVQEGVNGFLFTTAAEYCRAVERLAQDPALRDRLGDAGRTLVAESFDIRAVARRYLALYGFAPAPEEETARPAPRRRFAPLTASASIVDPRFRTRASLPAATLPMIVTTIDAEEEFDWSRPLSRASTEVSAMAHQGRSHEIFDRHGVVPTYLVDYPVASKPEGYRPLRALLRAGKCTIGTQLHPWVTPPFREEHIVRNSFTGNLPPELEYDKIATLTRLLQDRFEIAPQIYRAGRYGVGRRTADTLGELGYLVDTSVVPQRSFAPEGGPNFFGFPVDPYWIDAEHRMLEVPLSSALVGPLARFVRPFVPLVFRPGATLPALLAWHGMAERIKLTPEGTTIGEARRLVHALLASGTRVFTLSFHSPSLVPGWTPYVRSNEDLEIFLGWLDSFYDFFFREIGGVAATPLDVYRITAQGLPMVAAGRQDGLGGPAVAREATG